MTALRRVTAAQKICAALLLGIVFALAGTAFGFQQTPVIEVDPRSNIGIEIGLPFKEQPRSGFFPIHLKVQNGSSRQNQWELSIGSGMGRDVGDPAFRTVMTVDAGETREFDFFVPRAGLNSMDRIYGVVQGKVTGYGVTRGNFSVASGYASNQPTAFLAVTDTIANASWSSIEASLNSKGYSSVSMDPIGLIRQGSRTPSTPRGIFGSPVKMSELPVDERTFSGMTGLWLAQKDWEEAPAPLRDVIVRWVESGGHLFIASPSASGVALTSLPSDLKLSPHPVGFGAIALTRMLDNKVTDADVAANMVSLDNAPLPPWREDYQAGWKLASLFPSPRLNVAMVIMFVAVFAFVVGPCNFAWFAPSSRRYRLFLTVPLISAGGSVALFLCIALGDGFGGAGGRNVLVLMPAGRNQLTVVQEQASRSRLLFSHSFKFPAEAVISYVSLGSRGEETPELERDGDVLGGDWFRSRSGRWHVIQTSVPSRAEVVLQSAKGDAPVLLSSASTRMPEVFYMDDDGQYWRGRDLTPGRPLKLSKSSPAECEQWRKEIAASFSPNFQQLLNNVASRHGYFFAVAEPMSGIPVDTLTSIKWEKQTVLCVGSCTPGAEIPAKP